MNKVTDELTINGQSNDSAVPQPSVAPRLGRQMFRRGPNEWRIHYVFNNAVLASVDITVMDAGTLPSIAADIGGFVAQQIRQDMSGLVQVPAGALDGLPIPGLRPRG
jgi:hypothetical protein